MRILYVTPTYYPRMGGVEYVVKSLAQRFSEMGDDVTILSGEPSIDEPADDLIDGVRVLRWPTWAPGNAYHVPRLRSRLETAIREIAAEASVVHIHSAHSVLPVHAGLTAKESNPSVRLVFTLHYHGHGHSQLRDLAWKLLWRKRVAKLIGVANVIQAVSSVEAKRIVDHFPESVEKLVVVPNGIDEDVSNYTWTGQNSDYIMYAGRVERYKRLEAGVDLAEEMKLRFLVVGAGPYIMRLEKYAQLKLGNKGVFLPVQPRKKYLELLANASYAVNPSRDEAFSVFTAEALAMKVPAIVSKPIVEIFSTLVGDVKSTKIMCRAAERNEMTVLTASKANIQTWENVARGLTERVYACS